MPLCPECKTPEAYIGFLVVECLNPNCRHYVMPRGTTGQGQAFMTATLPPEVKAAIDEFMQDEYPREVEAIQNAVGNVIPVTMDFRNVGANLDGVKLLIRVLRRVRSTLCLRSGQHQASLKAGIQRVAIRHVGVDERKSCVLANGVLDLRVDVNERASYADPAPTAGYDEEHLDRLVADALDLELGPALRKLQEWLLNSISESNERHRLNLSLEVDWRSFTSSPDNTVNLRVIDQLQSELPRSILYWVYGHGANDKAFRKQLRSTLRAIRIEHVPNAGLREVGVEGSTVFYKLCLTEDGGVFGYELGEVLLSTVLSVQPPPPQAELDAWLGASGQSALQTISTLKETLARKPLESYVRRELAVNALKIQKLVEFPTLVDLDWIALSKQLTTVPLLVARVLNRVWGGLRIVTQNQEHAAALKTGSLKSIAIQFTADPTLKKCTFANETLALTVCPEQPGTGCFDENEIANELNQHLAVESRLVNLKQQEVPETMQRLCVALGSWIELEVDWAGFTSHPDPNKNQFALIQLSDVGLGWVYYALTGQAEESADFKTKALDRLRTFKLVHVPSAKEKFIRAEGSTFVYGLYLHQDYDGRFIIDHLKEIFEEEIEKMPPAAPPGKRVQEALTFCEQELKPAFLAMVIELLECPVTLELNPSLIGNNLIAAKQLAPAGLDAIAQALKNLSEDENAKSKLTPLLKKIELRAVSSRDENECTFEDGVLTVNTCLTDPNGSDALSWSDIFNTIFEALPDDEVSEGEEDYRDSRHSRASEESEDYTLWFATFKTQMLPQYVTMLSQMGGASFQLEGDWDTFGAQLTSPHASDARTCMEVGMPLFLTALVQLQMLNPTFGKNLKDRIKLLRFECAGPCVSKELRCENERLICRLQPAQGYPGAFDMAELTAQLPSLLLP